MTVNDPGPTRSVVHTTEVRESSAAWWIGALVAIVAILAVVFLVTRAPSTSDDALTTAAEQGRLQGALETTQSNLGAAQQSADLAAQRAADATQRAADAAAAASNRAADAAASAANRVEQAVPPVAPPAQ
jgi:hypothetical protein